MACPCGDLVRCGAGFGYRHGPRFAQAMCRLSRDSRRGCSACEPAAERLIRASLTVRALNQIIEWRGKPTAIRVDNGPEYISATLAIWAAKQGIVLTHIQPGKPQQNAYDERYNRTVRHEGLDLYIFDTIAEAQSIATDWLRTYNNERPNASCVAIGSRPMSAGIDGITPAQKLKVAA